LLRRFAVFAVFALVMTMPGVVGAQTRPLLSDSFSSVSVGKCFAEGSSIDANFTDVFNGYGTQCINQNHELAQSPEAPVSLSDTHAALATSKHSFSGTFDVTAEVTTIAQLRNPANNWEVAWLLWDYSNANAFYYMILKPQGWEVGKEWCNTTYSPCEQSQEFLATGSSPSVAVGTPETMSVDQSVHNGIPTFEVYDGSTLLATISDPATVSAPYTSGEIGLYDEEATIAWSSIAVVR
jgi:hypothetical protein